MGQVYKSRVVVLRRRPLGEADEIVSVLSPSRGRFDCIVRGTRKVSSSLVSAAEPFTELDAMFAKGKGLDYLTQGKIREAHSELRAGFSRVCWAGFLCDLVCCLLPEEEPAPEEFALLRDALSLLVIGSSCRLVALWFELRLLKLLGYEPVLDHCVLCGERLDKPRNVSEKLISPYRLMNELYGGGDEAVISLEDGGAVCQRCCAGDPYGGVADLAKPLRDGPVRRGIDYLEKVWIHSEKQYDDGLKIVNMDELAIMRTVGRLSSGAFVHLLVEEKTVDACEAIVWQFVRVRCPIGIRARAVLKDCNLV